MHSQKEDAEEWADDDNRRGRKAKNRKARTTTLTLDQKLDISTGELDALKKEGNAAETKLTQLIDTLKVRAGRRAGPRGR